MLSYLYRLATRFEHEHGYRANLVYLNPTHFNQLQTDLDAIEGLGEMVRFLGMEIIVETGISHPQVAYSIVDGRNAASV